MEKNINVSYFEAFKNPVLTKEEQFELIELYKKTGDVVYRDKLLNCNIRFIYNIAKKFKNNDSGVSLDDLMTVGCLGFIHAIEKPQF